MAAQPGTFPVLPPADLLADLQSCECPISPDDINHPTPARAQAIYEWWMNKMLGLNAEDVRRAADAQLDQLDHPDIYRDAMYIGVFGFALTQLLDRCAVIEFTIKDLTAPTAKRFQIILSGIINFYFFEQDQGDRILRPIEDEEERLAAEEEQLVAENAELRERLEQEREQRLANEQIMQRSQASNEAKIKVKNEKTTLAIKVREDAEALRAQMAELQKRNFDLKQDIDRLNLSISELNSQIVSSPEKLQRNIKELQYQLGRETEILREHEAKERATTNKINLLHQYASELVSCIRILDDWQADADKLRESEQLLNEHHDHHQMLLAELKELAERIALLERRITNGRDELLRMKDKMDRRREQAKQRKKTLEDAHASHFETKKHLEMKAAEKNRQAAEVEQQIRAMHASLQMELEKGEKAYKRIKDQVTLYSIRINKSLDSFNELNSQVPDI